MMCTLLFQVHLPPTYWVEALHMAIHLLNILLSTSLNNDTPFHKLFNKHPAYSHVRVFRCLCYPHLNNTNKIQHRFVPCIFLGYSSNHKGSPCLDLHTKQIIISCHVVFDENIFLFGSMTPNHSPDYEFLDIDASRNCFNDPNHPSTPFESSTTTTTMSTHNGFAACESSAVGTSSAPPFVDSSTSVG